MPPLARRAVRVGPLRVVLASPEYLLPLAYVENVADALSLAVRVPAAVGRAYTVVDTHAHQGDYARLYRRVSGKRWLAFYAPPALLGMGIGAIEKMARAVGKRSPITRHQVERTLRSARFDVSRAERELGWRPRVCLEDALRRSFGRDSGSDGNAAAPPMKSAA
jgi:nucleoside-diphosphate-sugar epimerase